MNLKEYLPSIRIFLHRQDLCHLTEVCFPYLKKLRKSSLNGARKLMNCGGGICIIQNFIRIGCFTRRPIKAFTACNQDASSGVECFFRSPRSPFRRDVSAISMLRWRNCSRISSFFVKGRDVISFLYTVLFSTILLMVFF